MKLICAWCHETVAEMPFLGLLGTNIKTCICPACYASHEKVLAHMGHEDHSTLTDADVGGEG